MQMMMSGRAMTTMMGKMTSSGVWISWVSSCQMSPGCRMMTCHSVMTVMYCMSVHGVVVVMGSQIVLLEIFH